jgi:hypothetical protein
MAFEAGSVIARFIADMSGFKAGVKSAQDDTKRLKSGVQDVAGAVTKAAAVFGVALGASAFVKGLTTAVGASIELENSLIGLSTVANAFGQDADRAKQSAIDLAKDGLMSVRESAEGLKNLLATGFSLPEAIKLMHGFKDAAAFNRQGTLEFGQAIVGATQGIKNQNSIMVDNVGITKNLSNILKEAGLSQNDLMNVTSDASVRQKLYNGLLKEAAVFQGDAGKLAETTSGKLSQLKTQTFMLSAAIGDALSPAVGFVADQLTDAMGPAIEWVGANSLQLKAIVVALAGTFMMLGQVVVGVAMTIGNLLVGNFSKARDSFYTMLGGMQTSFNNTQNKIQDIAVKAMDRQTNVAKKGFGEQSKAHSEKSAKMAKDLEEETRKFKEEMDKRAKKFKESLSDLIRAHLDKKKDLERDIKEENEDYAEQLSDRRKDAAERLDEMKTDHEDKVKDITEQIDEEVAKGAEADQKKLASLQAELLQENAEYDKQKLKVEADLLLATERMKKEHEKRLADFQESLNEENAILNKHKDDVAAVKDQTKEDDITRLKRQFAEENEAATAEHERRMVEISERGKALGDTEGAGIAGGLGGRVGEIEGIGESMGKNFGSNMVAGVSDGAKRAGEKMVSEFINSIKNKAAQFVSGIAAKGGFGPAGQLFEGIKWAADNLKNIPGFAEGGTVPGKLGDPRLVLAHGGEVITPPGRMASSNPSGQSMILQFDFSGALISDEAGAMRIGEKIGDAMIQKLKMSVRV